jgi:hypothetical protein
MSRPTQNNTRLEYVLGRRNKIFNLCKAQVAQAIEEVEQAHQLSLGLKLFQTRHIAERLSINPEWTQHELGHSTLMALIRECGYELTNWVSPKPESQNLRVWKKISPQPENLEGGTHE